MLPKFASTSAPEMGKPVAALVTVPEIAPGEDSKEKLTVVVMLDATIAPTAAVSYVEAAAVTV
jgi:hypothetical protein